MEQAGHSCRAGTDRTSCAKWVVSWTEMMGAPASGGRKCESNGCEQRLERLRDWVDTDLLWRRSGPSVALILAGSLTQQTRLRHGLHVCHS